MRELQLMLTADLDKDDGSPNVFLTYAEFDDSGTMLEEVGYTSFKPSEATFLAFNLLTASAQVETRAAVTLAMRTHKIPEETIIKVLDDTNKFVDARRKA